MTINPIYYNEEAQLENCTTMSSSCQMMHLLIDYNINNFCLIRKFINLINLLSVPVGISLS